MTTKQLGGIGGMNLPIDSQAQTIVEMLNADTTNLFPGDVVVLDNGSSGAFSGNVYSLTQFSNAQIPVSPIGYPATPSTAVAVANNGTLLNTFVGATTLTVTSTVGFPTAGSLLVQNSSNFLAVISYTSGGGSGTTFNNCTWLVGSNGTVGTNTLATNGAVTALGSPGFSLFGTGVLKTTSANDPRVFGVVLPYDRSVNRLASQANNLNGGLTLPTQANPLTANSLEGYVPGAVVPICVGGPCRIRISSAAVAVNGLLGTSATAGAAATTATVGTLVGIALQASTLQDANNTILCLVKLA